jgi:hypothetical protein
MSNRTWHWEQIGPGSDAGNATGSIKVFDDAPLSIDIIDSGSSRPSARVLADKIEALLAGNGHPIVLTARATRDGYGFVGNGVAPSVLHNSQKEISEAIEEVTGGERAFVTVNYEHRETAIALVWKD